MPALVQVKNLGASFTTPRGEVRVLEDVSFEIPSESVVALVGESGSGKSLTALALLGLLPPDARIESGEILYAGHDILKLSEAELCRLRGAEISMIFQEPMTSLNPVYTVGWQIMEVLKIHRRSRGSQARDRALELLKLVGMPAAELRLDAYPHQLSGGMRQRAMIAMALACEPKLLIADEPTTALDVTVQAQIIDLLRRLQRDLKMSTLFITHDLALVAEIASSVVVMYAGRIVETAPVSDLYRRPLHPYTKGLLGSIPGSIAQSEGVKRPRLTTIPGVALDPSTPSHSCRFANRCPVHLANPETHPLCLAVEPKLADVGPNRRSRCHYVEQVDGG